MDRTTIDGLKNELGKLYIASVLGDGAMVGLWPQDDEPSIEDFEDKLSEHVMSMVSGLYSIANMSKSNPPFVTQGGKILCADPICGEPLMCAELYISGGKKHFVRLNHGDELQAQFTTACSRQDEDHGSVVWTFQFPPNWVLGQDFECMVQYARITKLGDDIPDYDEVDY